MAVHIPKTEFSFDGRLNTSQDVPLTAPFPTESWATAVLSVRLHSKDAAGFGASANFSVVVQNAVQVPDEPSVIYAADLTVLNSPNGDGSPKLYTAAVTTPIGPMLRLVLRWNQGGSASAAAKFAISVDLVGRTA